MAAARRLSRRSSCISVLCIDRSSVLLDFPAPVHCLTLRVVNCARCAAAAVVGIMLQRVSQQQLFGVSRSALPVSAVLIWRRSLSCLQPMEIFVDDEAKLTLHGLVQHYIMLQVRG